MLIISKTSYPLSFTNPKLSTGGNGASGKFCGPNHPLGDLAHQRGPERRYNAPLQPFKHLCFPGTCSSVATEADSYGLAHRVTWAEIVADDPEMAILFPPAHPEFIRQFRATNPGRLIPLPLPGMFLSLQTLCAHMTRPLVATEANPGEFVFPGVVLTAEVFKTMVFDGVRPHNPLPGIFLHL